MRKIPDTSHQPEEKPGYMLSAELKYIKSTKSKNCNEIVMKRIWKNSEKLGRNLKTTFRIVSAVF